MFYHAKRYVEKTHFTVMAFDRLTRTCSG